MILIHYFVEEIVDIQFRAAVYDSLHLVEQFFKFDALSRGDVVESDLTVYALNDLHLQHRLLGNGTYPHVHLPLNLDQIDKLFGIRLFHLSLAHALNILEFLQGDGIIGSHLFQRHVLENNVWWTLQTF